MMKSMTWPTLRRFGSNSLARSANLWAVLIPLVAKVLHRVNEMFPVKIWDKEYSYHLGLPFSWQMLFFAAILFLIANVSYYVYCPDLIQETATFRDFADQGRSASELARYFREFVPSQGLLSPALTNLSNWFLNRDNLLYRPDVQPLFDSPGAAKVQEIHLSDVYDGVVDLLSTTRETPRIFASSFYLLGCLAVLIVVIQNIVSVARFTGVDWVHLC